MNYFNRHFLFILCACLAYLAPMQVRELCAQSLRIIDCRGNTKAFREVQSAVNSDVKVQVVGENGELADKAEIKLVNAQGQEFTALSESGVVTFGDIPPGVWQIRSARSNIFFSDIVVSDFFPGFWVNAGNVAIQAAQIVGIAAVAVGTAALIHEATKGGGKSGGGSSDGGGRDPADSDGGTCVACDSDAIAPSIPVFN